MSVHFSGWKTTNEGAPPAGGELESSQTPTDRGLYTMYHGTSVSSARLIISDGFRQSQKGMLGKGVYVSRDKKKADGYPKNSGHTERVVLQVQVGRVKSIDRDHHLLQYTWHDHGYDTAWVPPRCGLTAVRSGLEEDCVFDPDRVRVVAVVKAPDDTVMTELQELLGRASTEGMLGRGVYVSRDPQKASRYPLKLDPSESVVLKPIVTVGLTIRIDVDDHPMQFTWHENDYDMAWVPPNCGMKCVPSGEEVDCVFDPKRITVIGQERAPLVSLEELQ